MPSTRTENEGNSHFTLRTRIWPGKPRPAKTCSGATKSTSSPASERLPSRPETSTVAIIAASTRNNKLLAETTAPNAVTASPAKNHSPPPRDAIANAAVQSVPESVPPLAHARFRFYRPRPFGALQSSCMCRSLVLALASVAMLFAQKRPFDANALLELKRIGDPQISPDGKTGGVHRAIRRRGRQQEAAAGLDRAARRAARRARSRTMATATTAPRWSPDSKRIAYISDRGGSSQIWLMDPDGGNARQITNLATEADGEMFSPDGKYLVFTSERLPGMRRRRRLQQEEPRRRQRQQGEGAHLHRAALPALDRLGQRAGAAIC